MQEEAHHESTQVQVDAIIKFYLFRITQLAWINIHYNHKNDFKLNYRKVIEKYLFNMFFVNVYMKKYSSLLCSWRKRAAIIVAGVDVKTISYDKSFFCWETSNKISR